MPWAVTPSWSIRGCPPTTSRRACGRASRTRANAASRPGAVLALPVHADEQVAGHAPVAWRRLGRLVVLPEADREHALGGDAVAAGDALRDPVRGAAAGDGGAVGATLARDVAADVALVEAAQVRPRVALPRLQDRRVLERHDRVPAGEAHFAAPLTIASSAPARASFLRSSSQRAASIGRPSWVAWCSRATPARRSRASAGRSRGGVLARRAARARWGGRSPSSGTSSADKVLQRAEERRRRTRSGLHVARVGGVGQAESGACRRRASAQD